MACESQYASIEPWRGERNAGIHNTNYKLDTKEGDSMRIQPAYKAVGQISGTNTMRVQENANGMGVAVGLLSSHTPGAPVVDEKGAFVGFISEFDLLKAIEAGKDLNTVTAKEVMVKDRITINEATSIEQAVKIMEEKRLLNLPVEKNGVVAYSVTRHDLLRAWLGVDVGIDL